MSKYGFDKKAGGIELPKTVPSAPKRDVPSADEVADAVRAGEDLGFVSRDPEQRRKPGPKRREEQDRITIHGPKRVIDAFRQLARDEDVTLWEALELLQERKG